MGQSTASKLEESANLINSMKNRYNLSDDEVSKYITPEMGDKPDDVRRALTQLELDQKLKSGPKFESLLADDGLLQDQYRLQDEFDSSGLDAFRNEALRTGPSAWRGLQEQQLQAQRGQRENQMAQQANAQLARAQDSIASRGGLRSGSAERLAQQSQMNQLLGKQRLASEFGQRGTQLDIQDESNRLQSLSALPGMDMANAQRKAGISQFNIGSALGEKNAERAAKQNEWQQQMQAWAAQKQAEATPDGGKK